MTVNFSRQDFPVPRISGNPTQFPFYISIHTYVHTVHTYIHAYIQYIRTYICIYSAYVHTYVHTVHTYIHAYIVWAHFWRVRGPALVLSLLYVDVSGMRFLGLSSMEGSLECIWNAPEVSFVSQNLTIPAPWVFLPVRCSIPLVPWFHPGWLSPVSLRGIGRLS